MKRVLILGRNGQLAQALMQSLPVGVEAEAWGREQLDLADSKAIVPAILQYQPDAVINASAYTAVDKAESEPEQAFLINRDAVAEIGCACAQSGAACVHVSTDFVFDGSRSTAYRPEDECSPLGVYGQSKREGELALLEALPAASIVRTAWVYGAGGQNFMRTMLRLMSERDELGVVSDQIGAPTSVRNLAAVVWRLLDKQNAEGIWHYTDAGVASWYDFACAIYEVGRGLNVLNRDVKIRPITTSDYPTPAQRPAFSVLDSRRTHTELGLEPVHWRDALQSEMSLLKDQ